MPELPEVETIARNIAQGNEAVPSVIGKAITGANVTWNRIIADPDAEAFRNLIVGQQIIDVGRRAKYLVFTLSEGAMLIHLRMSGDLFVTPIGETPAKHIRLSLELDERWQLSFNNPRKFGRVWLLEDPEFLFKKLGPEPLDPDLTAGKFSAMLESRRRQIKPLLLDQGFIAGLGNIYTDEALHMAGIHPKTASHELTSAKRAKLLDCIRAVLEEGIRRNDSSIDWVYQGGEYQNYFRVYQRAGEPCPECGTPVERTVVGQRGTHICPNCQVL